MVGQSLEQFGQLGSRRSSLCCELETRTMDHFLPLCNNVHGICSLQQKWGLLHFRVGLLQFERKEIEPFAAKMLF